MPSNKNDLIAQTHLVDLSDNELLDFLGFCYEEIKNLDERMKADPEIIRIEEQLKELKTERYTDSIKALKGQLKAARHLARVKGLKFQIPGKLYGDED
jgi:hypothetical protein